MLRGFKSPARSIYMLDAPFVGTCPPPKKRKAASRPQEQAAETSGDAASGQTEQSASADPRTPVPEEASATELLQSAVVAEPQEIISRSDECCGPRTAAGPYAMGGVAGAPTLQVMPAGFQGRAVTVRCTICTSKSQPKGKVFDVRHAGKSKLISWSYVLQRLHSRPMFTTWF